MKLTWKTCFMAGFSILLLYLGIIYWPNAANLLSLALGAAMPLIIGCVIAYLVNILMSAYEKHYFPKAKNGILIKSRRPVCMLAAFITLIALVVLIVCLIVPQLGSCVQTILAEIPAFLEKAVDVLAQFDILPETIISSLEQIDWRSKIGQIVQVLTTGIGSVAEILISTVSTVFSGIVTALLSVIFSIYLLSGKETLMRQFQKLGSRYLRPSWYGKLIYFLSTANNCFHKYIVGQCVEAVILGGLCTVGMLILQLPYATMIGALTCFTALIPVAGAYISAFVGAFLILTVSPMKALIFLIFIVVLQQIEGNIIYPRVVGSSLGLPGIWVLAAVTIGGGIMGIGGMLLGVPLLASFYRLIREDVNKHNIQETSAS